MTVLAVVIVIFLVVFYGRSSGQDGGFVVVTVDGEEFGRYSLSDSQTIEITDAEGTVTNILEIKDGSARMQEADCPDKLCMKQNRISKDHENIVCLPNKVVAMVESDQDSGVDTIAK